MAVGEVVRELAGDPARDGVAGLPGAGDGPAVPVVPVLVPWPVRVGDASGAGVLVVHPASARSPAASARPRLRGAAGRMPSG